jgi:hypothetical protein
MIRNPSKATLKKYGLSLAEWLGMAEMQGGVCFICQKEPKSGILCVDHLHIKGWKKLAPVLRKKYVRGLLCSYCNLRLLSKGMTLEKAVRILAYLSRQPPLA